MKAVGLRRANLCEVVKVEEGRQIIQTGSLRLGVLAGQEPAQFIVRAG